MAPCFLSCVCLTQVRLQSASTDKRFHCSVCKKAFRLEMAAKVHVQQAHGGEATVEAGSGPGQLNAPQAPSLAAPSTNAPPQGPTIVEEVHSTEDRPLRRRSKPTPKPLHEPYRGIPEDAQAEMLAVWDAVGIKRLEGRFVHSSMVMKVFAANPDAGSEPLYDPVVPEGDNPFTAAASGSVEATERDAKTGGQGQEEHNIYAIDLNDAFAMATDECHGPFRVAKCENPFGKGPAPPTRMRLRPVQTSLSAETAASAASVPSPAGRSQTAEGDDPLTAPVTPYGQLPMFGQEPPAQQGSGGAPSTGALPRTGASEAAASVVASPFGALATDSPFAQRVSSQFAASPFVNGVFPGEGEAGSAIGAAPTEPAVASPFFGSHGNASPSPFVNAGTGSPFAAATPFGDAASMPQGDPGMFPNFSPPTTFPAYQPQGGDVGMPATIASEPAPQHECSTCGKTFTSHDGLRMHAKAKHGVELPRKGPNERKKRAIPELPAYIPSPVDLSMTTPFGKRSSEVGWTETEIVPHAVNMSNITITGRVLDVEQLDDGMCQITVYVAAEAKEQCETMTVRWSTTKGDDHAIKRDDSVFVSGTLRLLPVYDSVVNRYFSSPIIFAACPTGLVQKIC